MLQEFLCLTIFFNKFFFSKTKKMIFRISVGLCFSLGLTLIIKTGFSSFLTTWLCFNNIAYTMWSLLLLYELYDRDQINLTYSNSLLFYIFGLFFYTSCTIPVFGLWEYIRNNQNSYLQNLNVIHSIFNVTMYLSFSIGFIKEYQFAKYRKTNQNIYGR